METTIVVIVYNIDSRIFLLQMEAIRKFCKDDYIVEIIDNSNIEISAEAIRYHSKELGVSYIRTHSTVQNGSESHSFAAQLSWERVKDVGSKYFFYLDHDCIPVKKFSVKEIIGDKIFAGMGQGKNGKTYWWPGCVMIDGSKIDKDIIDFSTNAEFGLDTGGNLYKAIEHYGKDKCIFFNEEYYQNPYFTGRLYNHYVMINQGMFFHCIAGSNWANIEANEERINTLVTVIREKIDENES